MQIEQATASFDEDAAVLALLQSAFASMEGRIDPPSSLDMMKEADLRAKRAAEMLFVARHSDGGALIGCAFLADRGDHSYLGKLAVRPDQQGKGIGRALIEAAIAAAPHTVLRLQSRVELVENHATFARCGFVEIARTSHTGYARPTSITMEYRRGNGGG